MKKHQIQKSSLKLAREVIRSLDQHELGVVIGGQPRRRDDETQASGGAVCCA